MSSKYGKVPRGLWHERWFRDAPGNVRELALYLLTGPRSLSIPGVTLARPVVVADDLGWSQKRMRPALTALCDPAPARPAGWVEIDLEAGVLFVPSALVAADGIAVEMNRPTSLNAAVGWVHSLSDIPAGRARDRVIEVLTAHARQLDGEIARKIIAATSKATGRQAEGQAEARPLRIRSEQDQDPEGAPVIEIRRHQSQKAPEPDPGTEVVIGGVPVSGELAKDPGMVDVLAKALSRFGPVHAERTEDPDLARSRL